MNDQNRSIARVSLQSPQYRLDCDFYYQFEYIILFSSKEDLNILCPQVTFISFYLLILFSFSTKIFIFHNLNSSLITFLSMVQPFIHSILDTLLVIYSLYNFYCSLTNQMTYF